MDRVTILDKYEKEDLQQLLAMRSASTSSRRHVKWFTTVGKSVSNGLYDKAIIKMENALKKKKKKKKKHRLLFSANWMGEQAKMVVQKMLQRIITLILNFHTSKDQLNNFHKCSAPWFRANG